MKKLSFFLILTALFTAATSIAQSRTDYTRYVNPFIGTGGHGHTFPGAVMPFGMVQLSPDTRGANWDGSSGYHYSDDVIYGFSHTHLSGTGIPDGCDILFMPTVGEPQFFAKGGDKSVNGYASKFSHANEKAEPGYYSVKLDDDAILAELTATKRVGLHRYTFDKPGAASLIVDLTWRDKLLDGELTITGNRIEGFRRSSSWAKDQIVYFVAEFSLPIKTSRPGPEMIGVVDGRVVLSKLKPAQAALAFDVKAGQPLLVKVAISSVSIEGARKNLAAELPGWDFDKVRAEAKSAWNKELSKIEVSGGTPDQMTTFYTALYHTMIHPSLFSDVDGSYRGLDGKIHNIADDSVPEASVRSPSVGSPGVRSPHVSKGSTPQPSTRPIPKAPDRIQPPATSGGSDQYTVFSLWDTFRATHPLYTIIDQKRTVDFINTFLRMYEQGGRLPVWELWGNETDTMIGYHAVSVIADAMAKGIKGFDYEKAYGAAKHSAELDREGLAAYKRRGYISSEDENESVSKTLEYAYDDWCIAQMAALRLHKRMFEAMGEGKDYSKDQETTKRAEEFTGFLVRSLSFMNLFDSQTNFMRPKKNGGFLKPFAPNEVTFHFTEGNSWQYTFFTPQDVNHLVELMGSRDKFAAKLDDLFNTDQKLIGRDQPDITGLIGQYAHGNEPSHHIPYLYNYAGQPWKTQKYVREIMDEFYKNSPDGLIGNEDCGQMSAWYVLSASGFYPVIPGSFYYDIGTPLFPEVSYHLENGKSFTIRAKNVSRNNIYIGSAKLNRKVYKKPYLPHFDIMTGGVLEFTMSEHSNKSAFSEDAISYPLAVPFGITLNAVPVPEIVGDRVFSNNTTVEMRTTFPSLEVHYTLDGSEPSEKSPTYITPINVNKSITVKALALNANGGRSRVVEAEFLKRPNDWTVTTVSPYSYQYTGGGDEGLVDGIRGTTSFTSEWQGYQGKDFVATIDLQRETEVRRVGGGFLQVARSWIWMPTHVEFEVSSDGINFTQVADVKTVTPVTDMEPTKTDYTADISPVKARYVRVHAYNLGKIPSWHPGAGGDPWIFVDEILIN